jgi:hypothetical protein
MSRDLPNDMAGNLESRIGLEYDFKSAGERKIAEVLNKYGIDFKYESPIAVFDQQDKLRIWYPDFYLPEFGIYVEFFGLEGNPEYDEMTSKKLEAYKYQQLNVVSVYQKQVQSGLEPYLLKQIRGSLAHRQSNFYHKMTTY